MIKRKDVITIKIPFPDINAALAKVSHMYICRRVAGEKASLVKCQTLKPYMLSSGIMRHYWDEEPDILRNPFEHKTRIDCDKEFYTVGVQFSDSLKTTTRPDVCDDVIENVERELLEDGYEEHELPADDMKSLNPDVR